MAKRKPISIEEYFSRKLNLKNIYSNKYKVSLENARGSSKDEELIEKLKLRGSNVYSLRTKILKNPWVNQRPASKSTQWLFREVFKNPSKYRWNQRLMAQGNLYMFEYKNPKFKDTLDYYDKYPLVLSLGPVSTNLGIRNLGINLHLLPPKIRIIAICVVFEIYKKIYRYQIFSKNHKPVDIKYQDIVRELEKYGIKFAIRMYIPSRQNQIIHFPYEDWHKAIFVPSRGYEKIRAAKLIQEWKKYCRNNHISISENIDWKKII